MACRGGSCKMKRNKSRPSTPAQQPLGAVGAIGAPPIQPEIMNQMGQLPQQQAAWNQVPQMINQTPPDTRSGWQKFKEGAITGKPAQNLYFPRFNQQQGGAFQQVLQQALQGLASQQQNQMQMQGQNTPFDFAPIEQQAREGFAQKTIPSIAERFTSMGAQRSSAFPQQLSQAGAGLETNLAALKAGYGMDQQRLGMEQQRLGLGQQDLQQRLLLSLLGVGLTPQYESGYTPRQPGFLENLGVGAAQSVGSFLPYLAL